MDRAFRIVAVLSGVRERFSFHVSLVLVVGRSGYGISFVQKKDGNCFFTFYSGLNFGWRLHGFPCDYVLEFIGEIYSVVI